MCRTAKGMEVRSLPTHQYCPLANTWYPVCVSAEQGHFKPEFFLTHTWRASSEKQSKNLLMEDICTLWVFLWQFRKYLQG